MTISNWICPHTHKCRGFNSCAGNSIPFAFVAVHLFCRNLFDKMLQNATKFAVITMCCCAMSVEWVNTTFCLCARVFYLHRWVHACVRACACASAFVILCFEFTIVHASCNDNHENSCNFIDHTRAEYAINSATFFLAIFIDFHGCNFGV